MIWPLTIVLVQFTGFYFLMDCVVFLFQNFSMAYFIIISITNILNYATNLSYAGSKRLHPSSLPQPGCRDDIGVTPVHPRDIGVTPVHPRDIGVTLVNPGDIGVTAVHPRAR